MTRERFRDLQMAAITALKTDMEEHMKNPMVLDSMRDDMKHKYQTILKLQTEWEGNGFWTMENEQKYAQKYKNAEE